MRNIPDFTCPHGAAQLILEELPYTQTAYVLAHWFVPGELSDLLIQCRSFCRLAGAERVLALSMPEEAEWETLPTAFQVLAMQLPREQLPPGEASLFPVTSELLEAYLQHHNRAMLGIDGARQLTERDSASVLSQGYFVHRDGVLLGLGQVEGNTIRALAAAIPGAGAAVLGALGEAIQEELVRLSVTDTNARAVRFYEKMGFLRTGVEERWVELKGL